MTVVQIRPGKQWPSGKGQPIAVLAMGVSELTERYGLQFEPESDDLDSYSFAAIELPNGRQAWIQKYDRDARVGAAIVYVDAVDNVPEPIQFLAEAMEVDKDEFVWTSNPGHPLAASAD